MKNNIKKICIVIGIVIIIFLLVNILKRCNNVNNDDTNRIQEQKEIEETVQKVLRSDRNIARKEALIRALLNDEKYFIIYDDFYTKHFKEKYKTKYDIMSNYDSINIIESGKLDSVKYDGLYYFDIENKDNKEYTYMIRQIYKLDITEDNQLNDFEVVEEFPINQNTKQRLDGKKDIKKDIVSKYLKLYTLDKPETTRFFDTSSFPINVEEYEEYMKMKQIPLAENCQIINKPDIDLIETGNYEDSECDIGYKTAKIKFKDGSIRYYKFNLEFNDNAEFTKIEYVEVNQEEYKKILKTIR